MGPEIICTKIYFVCIHRPRFLDRSLARIIFHIRSWSVSKCLQSCYASNWSPNLRAMANHSKTQHRKQKVRKTSLHFQDLPIQSFQPAVLPSKLRKCSNYPFAMHGGFALWTWCCCCYFVDFCILLCFLIFLHFVLASMCPSAEANVSQTKIDTLPRYSLAANLATWKAENGDFLGSFTWNARNDGPCHLRHLHPKHWGTFPGLLEKQHPLNHSP